MMIMIPKYAKIDSSKLLLNSMIEVKYIINKDKRLH